MFSPNRPVNGSWLSVHSCHPAQLKKCQPSPCFWLGYSANSSFPLPYDPDRNSPFHLRTPRLLLLPPRNRLRPTFLPSRRPVPCPATPWITPLPYFVLLPSTPHRVPCFVPYQMTRYNPYEAFSYFVRRSFAPSVGPKGKRGKTVMGRRWRDLEMGESGLVRVVWLQLKLKLSGW